MKIGVIGCGVISEIYLTNLTGRFSSLDVCACADAFPEKSTARAAQFGIEALTPEQLLTHPDIDAVLNLTTPAYHAAIALAALKNGKHVYGEKPFALNLAEADAVLSEAERQGLRVGCAPDTFLGAGVQTACRAVADGWIGRPVAASAFFTCRGHERWHPEPGFYYQPGGGPNLDMGPYYITALVAALGRVKRVLSMSGRAFSERVIGSGPKKGERVPVETDTHFGALLELECGVIATVMLSFDIWSTRLPFLEIYGTGGSVSMPDPNFFDGPVLLSGQSKEFHTIPLQSPFTENCRGLGLAEMCSAIAENRPHRASGALGRHVLEVLDAMTLAATQGGAVTLRTSCERPELLPAGLTEAEYGF